MGLAKHQKLSKSEYNSLTTKDEDTFYAVNENGDFSEENLEDSAELYIGDKKITPTIVGTTGESTTAVMHQKAVTDAIDGLQSDIEAKSEDFYGECNISPSTVAKTVTTLNGGFVLKKGAKVSVKFFQGHTATTMTLNVDGTGAKNVYRDGNSPKSNMIKAYNVYEFVYDGTYWRIVGVDTDTTYSNATSTTDGLMSSEDKVKLDAVDDTYLPLTGGVITGTLETKGLTHLANSTSAVLQAFPQSEASGSCSIAIGYSAKVSGSYATAIGRLCQNFGNYSAVIGYYSINGRRSADTSKPYITMSYFRPLSITVEGAVVYGVNIPKGESVSYMYNGVEYTAENTNTTYTAILVVIENAARNILDVPLNYASIYNSKRNYGNMRILSITEISDNIFAVVLNGYGSTLSDNLYRSYVALPIKTNSTQYTGNGGVNCGYESNSTGRFSFTSGEQSFNGSSESIINGRFNYTGGSYISVFGQNNTVITSINAFVTGINNFCAAACFISGNNNLAVHNGAKILGSSNITTAQNQIIVGNYNDTNSNSLFIIANGTSENRRSNAMTVSSSGVVTANTFIGDLQGNLVNTLPVSQGGTGRTIFYADTILTGQGTDKDTGEALPIGARNIASEITDDNVDDIPNVYAVKQAIENKSVQSLNINIDKDVQITSGANHEQYIYVNDIGNYIINAHFTVKTYNSSTYPEYNVKIKLISTNLETLQSTILSQTQINGNWSGIVKGQDIHNISLSGIFNIQSMLAQNTKIVIENDGQGVIDIMGNNFCQINILKIS